VSLPADTTAVMISCRQREHTERAKTLEGLAVLGITPHVQTSSCDPASGMLNRHAAWHAISTAGDRHVLFLEDDVDVKPSLLKAVDLARAADVIVDFCLLRHHILGPDGLELVALGQRRKKLPLSLVKVPAGNVVKRGGWYGTQAVFLPNRVVKVIMNAWTVFISEYGAPNQNVQHGFDFWLKEHANGLGGIWVALPNPVQHRDPPKMTQVTGHNALAPSGARRSASFDWSVDE